MNLEMQIKSSRLRMSSGEEKVLFLGSKKRMEVVMEGIMGPVMVEVDEPVIETPDQTISKATLRAHEIADLDPYNVRKIDILTRSISEVQIPEIERVEGKYFHGSSKLMIAEVLKEKGYEGIQIMQVPGEEYREVRIKNERTQYTFEELCEAPELKILEEVTEPHAFSRIPDFSKGTYHEFDNPRNQRRLTALYYQTKIKQYKEASKHFKMPLTEGKVEEYEKLIEATLESYTVFSRGKTVIEKEKIPSRGEVKHWVKKIITYYL